MSAHHTKRFDLSVLKLLRLAFVMVFAGLLVGCSDEVGTVEEAADIAGCYQPEVAQGVNIFTGKTAVCLDGSVLYWFPTKQANERHFDNCQRMGGQRIASGENWSHYDPNCEKK